MATPGRPIDGGPITDDDRVAIARANRSGRVPVVFVHGLWLPAASWDRWAAHVEAAGYCALQPGWPGEPATVAAANAAPDTVAGTTLSDVAEHHHAIIRGLERRPVIVGHGMGGLVAQMLAGRGLACVSVIIAPAPFRGVLPLPRSTWRAAMPVLRNPANRRRAVALTFEQFRANFANAVPEQEARELYVTWAVPAPGAPLFQTAGANLNPWTEARVDTRHPERGAQLLVGGTLDRIVPPAITEASYRREARNESVTELVVMPGRGHSLTIDHGWGDVADVARAFVDRFLRPVDGPMAPTGGSA